MCRSIKVSQELDKTAPPLPAPPAPVPPLAMVQVCMPAAGIETTRSFPFD